MRRKLSRLCAAALALLLAASLCVPALADAEDTIYINNTDDLAALAERCSYDAWSKDKTVVLQRDIDLGGVDFRPIPSFGGVFDGGGHTISGLSVASGVSPAGLFGTVTASGAVRDLKVEGSVAPSGSGDAVGGVVGVNRGVIENCAFTGTVEGEKRTGGVAGVNASGGTLRQCSAEGGVFGKNMTGGVVGANHGEAVGCVNRAYVNTNTLDPALRFDKLDLGLTGSLDTLASPDAYNAAVDSGGVAGYSDGSILSCHNYGGVGYQHIGYNVGGVAGRSSGHIATCTNAASVYGRRAVGGVVGMAEPHVTINLTDASLASVRQSLGTLSSTVDKTIADAEGASDALSARLTSVSGSIGAAEDKARSLAGTLSDGYNEAIRELNRGGAILDNTLDRLGGVTEGFLAAGEATDEALRRIQDAGVSDELGGAATDAKEASLRLRSAAEDLRGGAADLKAALSAEPWDQDGAARALSRMSDAVKSAKSARKSIDRAAEHVSDAAAAGEELTGAAASLEAASRQLGDALNDADALLAYLNAQEQLQFQPMDVKSDSDALYESLRGVSDALDALNRESKSSADTVLADVRLINRQFTALMNALLDTVEDAQGYTPTSVIEDTSDEDVDAVIAGKVLLCSNGGAVSGDIDVGGVAGSLLVYNALDPENDTDSASNLLRRRYELQCVLDRCTNTGEIAAKRENVGAVCGSATLGVVRGCVGCGSVSSESGDCVGGVAGYGDSVLRRCWAKCSLSGGRYVGGIVGGTRAEGSALRVEDCRSLVEIARFEQYAGAIGGGTEGAFSGNRFVSDTLSGVDRVSYVGRAEPVDYATLVSEDDTPAALRGFTLRFVAGGETVKTVPFQYGASFDQSVFPDAPAVEGKFARWDRDDLTDLRFDTTVSAIYVNQLTALASDFTRSAARPAFFVEGAFDDAAAFSAEPAVFGFDAGTEGAWRVLRSWRRSILEQWQLSMPDGEAHTLRYLPPEGAGDNLTLYLLGADGRWTAAEHGEMGSYLTFDAEGGTVALTVVSASTPWWLWTLLIVFLLGAAALTAQIVFRKHHKAARTPEEKKKRRKLRILLVALVAALGLGVGAAVRLAPRISETMGLYRLVRNYAERGDLDLSLSLSAELDGKPLDAELSIYVTQCEGKTVSCVQWDDVPIWFCDGALLLENGKAYRADGVVADYSQLLANAAALYRAVDVTLHEENGVKTYHASASGEDARRVLSTLLPKSEGLLGASERADFDLVVTDGELTSLLVAWDGGENRASAELRLLGTAGSHTPPAAVRAAIADGSLANAPEIGDDLSRLLLAWTEGASRETLSADVRLKANCGPLLVDESLVWQRSRAYGETLSCLTRQGGTVYYTDTAACTGGGLALPRADASYAGTSDLLRLACKALLLGEADCSDVGGARRYTVTLDADAMAAFADLVAPDARSLGLTATGGTVRLDVRDASLDSLAIRVEGSVRVVRADVPAAISAQLDFDQDAAFHAPSDAVLAALGLA